MREFDYIYVFNLRGNARNFADAKNEGQTFFPTSMAGVSLLICCRKPKTNRRQRDGVLSYVQVADGLTRYQKKEELRQCVRFGSWKGKSVLKESNFQRIKPDDRGDWIEQVDPKIFNLYPLFGNEPNRIFLKSGPAVNSRRDAWVYDFDRGELEARIWRMMEFFNRQPKDKKEFYGDKKEFDWTHRTKELLRRGFKMEHDPSKIVTAMYRSFQKIHLYYCESVIERIGLQPSFFPIGKENRAICVSYLDVEEFACLMVDCIPDTSCVSTIVQTLPRWVWSKDGERVSNINPKALALFNDELGITNYELGKGGGKSIPNDELRIRNEGITEDDLFYYVYGFLHSEKWRKQWEVTLRKEAARIELPRSLEEFRRISQLGTRLADLHLNYETIPPFEDLEIEKADDFDERNPKCYEVEKMKYGGKRGSLDRSVIQFNRFLTIRGIPPECHNYRLGARSALDWLVDRYRVKTDRRSSLTRNPNSWLADDASCSAFGGGQYLFNLIPRIINLSLKTQKLQNESEK